MLLDVAPLDRPLLLHLGFELLLLRLLGNLRLLGCERLGHTSEETTGGRELKVQDGRGVGSTEGGYAEGAGKT
jgi:hypothetical protein